MRSDPAWRKRRSIVSKCSHPRHARHSGKNYAYGSGTRVSEKMKFHRARQVSNRALWPLSVVGLVIIISCNRTHETRIAVIPKASADIFWQSVHAGAVKSSWANNVKIIWDGPPNETDIAGEMKIVETMINRQVDAIALAPSDRSAFKIVLNRAAAAHIPVVIYDSA